MPYQSLLLSLLLLLALDAKAAGFLVSSNGTTKISSTTAGLAYMKSSGTTKLVSSIATVSRGDGAYSQTNGTTLVWPAMNDSATAYWKLDEAVTSGNRSDSVDTHTLTEHGTTGTNAGIIGLAAVSDAAGDWLSTADGADFSGGTSFSVQAWVKWQTVGNTTPVYAKWINNFEWLIWTLTADLQWIVRKLDNSGNIVVATGVAPATNVWYHICAGFDSTNQVIWMQTNAGPRLTTAYTTACRDTTDVVSFPSYGDGSGRSSVNIDEVGYWKRVLTTNDVRLLYNSGAALAHPFR